jgi:hypothetical protein
MAYANNGEFNVLYPTRRKMAALLKRIVDAELGEYSEGTLVSSIRINAKITGFQKLEIQIVAAYYFIFLNNGAYLWNGGVIAPRDFVAQFTDALASAGITNDIYSQYTEWLIKKYPLIEVVPILERQQKLVYTFEALYAPPSFSNGYGLDV